MTAAATNIDIQSPSSLSIAPRGPFDISLSKDELQFLALAVGVLGIWGGAVATFGFAGLIVGALSLVAIMFAMLVIISRG